MHAGILAGRTAGHAFPRVHPSRGLSKSPGTVPEARAGSNGILRTGAAVSQQVLSHGMGQARGVAGAWGDARAAVRDGMAEDITERKLAEHRLREAQKMEVIGRLVGGVAHDFNNLLTGVTLYCDLLLAGLDRRSPLRHHAEEIRMAGEQGAALIQQLLAISRKQVAEPKILSL